MREVQCGRLVRRRDLRQCAKSSYDVRGQAGIDGLSLGLIGHELARLAPEHVG
jgi:hypothetical protein